MARKTQKADENAERIRREFLADMFADKMLEIADNATTAAEAAEAERKIERLKRRAAKIAPWKYGEPGAH
jgi:hypothetical protein